MIKEALLKINNWFTKQKQEFAIPEDEKIVLDAPKEVLDDAVNKTLNFGKTIEECPFCKSPIETYQKRRKFNGQVFHKKCQKNLIKLAKEKMGA